MDKSQGSTCSPVHKKFKNLASYNICLRSSDKEIYNIFKNKSAFLLEHSNTPYTLVNAQIHGEYNEQELSLYVFAFKS